MALTASETWNLFRVRLREGQGAAAVWDIEEKLRECSLFSDAACQVSFKSEKTVWPGALDHMTWNDSTAILTTDVVMCTKQQRKDCWCSVHGQSASGWSTVTNSCVTRSQNMKALHKTLVYTGCLKICKSPRNFKALVLGQYWIFLNAIFAFNRAWIHIFSDMFLASVTSLWTLGVDCQNIPSLSVWKFTKN